MAKAGSISLIVPGLFEPFNGIDERAFPKLPALSLLLGRSDRSNTPHYASTESLLYSLLYPNAVTTHELPVAQLRWLNDFGQLPATAVICADPVYLRPDKTELRLFGLDQVKHDSDHLDQLIAYLNTEYASDPFTFVSNKNNHWYLCLDKSIDVTTTPLSMALGQNVTTILPQGSDARWLKNLMNETQMMLHNYAHKNDQMGKQYGPNSVWFHGAGQLPASVQAKNIRLLASDAFSKGLASYSGIENSCCPDAVTGLEASPVSESCIIIDALRLPARYGDFNGWVSCLTDLEQQWFRPLLMMLKKRQISQLNLYNRSGYKYTATFSNIMKIWRKNTAFYALSRGYVSGA